MIYGLCADGTYDKIKSDENLNKKLHKYEYVLFDNETHLKGPIFTLVKSDKIARKYEYVNIIMTIVYLPIDTPCDAKFMVFNEVTIDNYCRQYSIYPFLNQIVQMNEFREYYVFGSDNILVNNIEIECKNGKSIKFDWNMHYNDGDFNKFFKKNGLITHVKKVLKDNHIIFKNKKWKNISEIPK